MMIRQNLTIKTLQSCSPRGPPDFRPDTIDIVNAGATFINVSWSDPNYGECEDTFYQVVLNNAQHVHKTRNTWQLVEDLLPGSYHVSLLAENEAGQSEYVDAELEYNVTGLSPPAPDDITVSVDITDDNKLFADVSWIVSDDVDPEHGRYLVSVVSPDENTEVDKVIYSFKLNESSIRFQLSDSHPHAQVFIQSRELGSISDRSEPVSIFR